MNAWLAAIRWRWVALGLSAYFIFLLATLPASLATNRLQKQGVIASGVSGSIWNGRATSLQMRGQYLGAVQWKIHPSRLLLGRLNLDINVKRDDGYLDANISVRSGDRMELTDLRASLPIPALTALANMSGTGGGMLSGWKGVLQLQLTELAVEKGWPTQIIGRIEATDLVGPARQPASIGSYKIEFGPQATAGELQGNITSQADGPLDVVGVVRLLPARQYVIDAQVGTRDSTPASIRKALEYLGTADAQGRRPLSLSGSI
jgi:general secretion pathway protein N